MARSSGVPQRLVVDETARALMGFSSDQLGLVTACRRVVERHRSCGALVWMAARVMTSSDPVAEIRRCATAVAGDPTGRLLADALAPDATIVMLGWPEESPVALGRRGDVAVLVVDSFGEGAELADELSAVDVAARAVRVEGLGAAVASVAQAGGVVVLEADAVGPTHALAVAGSLAAASTARALGVPVWLVVPCGRSQPGVMWDRFVARLAPEPAGRLPELGVDPAGVPAGDPADDFAFNSGFDSGFDTVPLDLVDVVVRPTGLTDVASMVASPDCPSAPELFAGDVF